jgi:hypothetical protein
LWGNLFAVELAEEQLKIAAGGGVGRRGAIAIPTPGGEKRSRGNAVENGDQRKGQK